MYFKYVYYFTYVKKAKKAIIIFLLFCRVGHILNVTREIDNFFPGMFDYLNIRVLDDEKTDLLKYWDNTFKYITKAKNEGSKVLVHCKMGVSRSASVVIAYAMKAYNWNFEKAMKHVKAKRTCIKPNTSFIAQLETYQGILDAMKNKEKLQRSKSETNLKSPEAKHEKKSEVDNSAQTDNANESKNLLSGRALKQIGARPKSWSPDNHNDKNLLLEQCPIPAFLSLENLSKNNQPIAQNQETVASNHVENARNILMPFNNGQSYSVSPNQIVHIPGSCKKNQNETKTVEPVSTNEKKGMVLNLTNQFEGEKSQSSSPNTDETSKIITLGTNTISIPQISLTDNWDPGEKQPSTTTASADEDIVWTSSTVLKQQTVTDNTLPVKKPETENTISKVIVRKEGDPFSNRLDKVFDREERKQKNTCPPTDTEEVRKCPSRQSSWSSYDSAVVLGYQGETREAPSRHSSWGSGDTRTLPSRNSSWGSYDMRRGQIGHAITEKDDKMDVLSASSSGMFPYDKDDIPWYPGTVKRTKQKLESNTETSKRVCSVPRNLDTSVNNQNVNPSSETLPDLSKSVKTNIIHYQSSPTLCSKRSSENVSKVTKDIDISPQKDVSQISKRVCSIPKSLNCMNAALSNKEVSQLPDFSSKTYKNSRVHYQSSPTLCSKKSSENISVVTKEIDINTPRLHESRLSVSAPGSSTLSVISNDFVPLSPKSVNRKDFSFSSLKSGKNSDISKDSLVNSAESNGSVQGIVKNLKKEFEAKNNEKLNGTSDAERDKSCSNSAISPKVSEDTEDISVKELVGKYEICKTDDDFQTSPILRTKSHCIYNNKHNRFSCIEVLSNSKEKESYKTIIPPSLMFPDTETKDTRQKKPHINPNGPLTSFVTSSVVKAAAKKQQLQLRNRDYHSSYNVKPRNHPTHNTM